jgi:transcriptional regulator with XRE-family HTH domain
MQDLGYELRRMGAPRNSVNSRPHGKVRIGRRASRFGQAQLSASVGYHLLYTRIENQRGGSLGHVARKFERFLEIYRHPDGGRWTGAKLARATGSVVHRSYVTNLRKGRIASPGYEKLAAIAKAMGFPPEAWFEEGLPGAGSGEPADAAQGLAERIALLFEVVRNPKTGEPYTIAEVARMSLGTLSEGDVEGMRGGSVTNPPLDRVLALADAFGVHSSYLVDRGNDAPLLDQEIVDALRDDTVRAIARESARLAGRERKTTLGIVRQFEDVRKDDASRASSGGQ